MPFDQLQSLTVFTTYSAVDHHWFDLHRPMPGYKEDDDAKPTPQQRTQWLIDNPHLADWWFWQCLQEWKGVFLGNGMGNQTWHWDRAGWQSRASLHAHGCSSWKVEAAGNQRLTDLSRQYLKGFLARRQLHQGRQEVGATSDGGVSDEEYARVQEEICTFLVAVGFTARNPESPAPGEAVSEEQQRAAAEGLSRDMRDFSWEDEEATREHYSLLVNACQRHTRCGTYCLRGGETCRVGYPHDRQDVVKVEAHCLVSPPTDREEDWQVVVLPPRSTAGEEEHDGFVNRHVMVQLLGWGGNVDSSFIVDRGMAYRYMVKYASKGESMSKEAQKMLTEMINAAHAVHEDERQTMSTMLKRAMMRATTRRDMGCQEVMHNLLQMESVLHNLTFANVSTDGESVEIDESGRCTTMLQAYSCRLDARTWNPNVRNKPTDHQLVAMSFAEFAAKFNVASRGQSRGQINRLRPGTNRVITFKPWGSSNPRGDSYPDYCRNSLVRFRAWNGAFESAWGGLPGEAAGTPDPVAWARMVTNWVAFATIMRDADSDQRPPGFSARDLQTAPRRRRRRRGAGAGELDDRSDGDERSDDDDWSDDEHLDDVYGDARPGDHSEEREWEQDSGHDWSNNGWVSQADGPPNPESWIKHQLREGATGARIRRAAEPPTLNPKQALAVEVVQAHAAQLDTFRAAVEADAMVLPPLADPLHMVLTGTAGTGKTVVINEMVRRTGPHRFMLMAPTGCAACGIRGQVRCCVVLRLAFVNNRLQWFVSFLCTFHARSTQRYSSPNYIEYYPTKPPLQ